MKCPYVSNLICDYPISTGDIICTTCSHFVTTRSHFVDEKGIKETGATPIFAWLLEKIKSLFK